MDEGKPMDKDDFKKNLLEARHMSEVNEKEVDLLFDVLDISKDGLINNEDFRSIESLGYPRHKQMKKVSQSKNTAIVSDLDLTRQEYRGPK